MILSKEGISYDTDDFADIKRLKALGYVEEKVAEVSKPKKVTVPKKQPAKVYKAKDKNK